MPDNPEYRAIPYIVPDNWIKYDRMAILTPLVEAKSAVLSLIKIPYQRNWVEALQEIQLKREVAGTSKIEGADFTDRELDAALDPKVAASELLTRSQRQAHAAVKTYRWISQLTEDRPLDERLIQDVHSLIVGDCDDDHCQPGALRKADYNVTFGIPRHRGCEGGERCDQAFTSLVQALNAVYKGHDPLVQALALHYHFAAMHPFMDGNGRTARAVEALMLKRAGLTDNTFIAMSNYYYDEKTAYLAALSEVRARNNDLTPFLIFGLKGITLQCHRLYSEIRKHMERALFRNMMYDLFNRLESTRKRVIKDRQIEVLKILLEVEKMDWAQFYVKVSPFYKKTVHMGKTIGRDLNSLIQLGAIEVKAVGEGKWEIAIRPQWPQEITESAFFEKIKKLPKGRTYPFLP